MSVDLGPLLCFSFFNIIFSSYVSIEIPLLKVIVSPDPRRNFIVKNKAQKEVTEGQDRILGLGKDQRDRGHYLGQEDDQGQGHCPEGQGQDLTQTGRE